jgi:hypothetical protein
MYHYHLGLSKMFKSFFKPQMPIDWKIIQPQQTAQVALTDDRPWLRK